MELPSNHHRCKGSHAAAQSVFSPMDKPATPTAHTAAEFRDIARQCRLLAERAESKSERHQLLMLAESWEILAAERELLDRQK